MGYSNSTLNAESADLASGTPLLPYVALSALDPNGREETPTKMFRVAADIPQRNPV